MDWDWILGGLVFFFSALLILTILSTITELLRWLKDRYL